MAGTTYTLAVESREKHGSKACRALRAEGKIPAVLYGSHEEASSVSLDTKAFSKVWQDAGESSVIHVKGLLNEKDVLIQDVSCDPVSGLPVHADLLVIDTKVAVEVDVELVFVGVAPAEKELGGTLIKVMHELTIEALPNDLPHEIEVDISGLATFDDQLHVRDITLPAGVKAIVDADEVVALVQEQRAEEEVAGPTGDIAEIEVEKKGKEEETPEA